MTKNNVAPALDLRTPFEVVIDNGLAGVHPPADNRLPGFPDAFPVRRKTLFARGRRRHRWKTEGGAIYEWDYRHGTVEAYDRRGNHQGEFDSFTGNRIGPADPRRRVEP